MDILLSLGLLFKNEREKKNLCIKKIAKDLCLNVDYLKDIENGKINNIENIYLIFYVEKYAKYLELDADLLKSKYSKYLYSIKKKNMLSKIVTESIPKEGDFLPSFFITSISMVITIFTCIILNIVY